MFALTFVFMCMLVVVVVIIARATFDARSYLLLEASPLVRDVPRSISACVLYSFSVVIRLSELQVVFRWYFCSPVESLD